MPLPDQIFPVERSITQFKGLSVEQAIIIIAEQIAMIQLKQNEIIEKVNEHSALLMKQNTTQTENELREMMRDPKYWRDHDPETVRKIEQGFKKLYGGDNDK